MGIHFLTNRHIMADGDYNMVIKIITIISPIKINILELSKKDLWRELMCKLMLMLIIMERGK